MARFRALALAFPVVLLTLSCGGGYSPSEPAAQPQVVIVQVRDNSYEPRSITIRRGDTVRWVMAGSDTNHTVTAVDGAFDSGTVFRGAGAVFERRFDTSATTYDYACQAHQNCCQMQGSVRVGDDAPPSRPGYH